MIDVKSNWRSTMNYKITSEMRCFFNKRTKMHIDYVIDYGNKIHLDFSNHDQDKYSPELIDAYTLLTWQKNHDDFKLPTDVRSKIKEAVNLHLKNNKIRRLGNILKIWMNFILKKCVMICVQCLKSLMIIQKIFLIIIWLKNIHLQKSKNNW